MLEVAGIAVFLGLASYLSVRIFASIKATPDFLAVAACILVAFLAADLISGPAHWAADTLFTETTPLIGKHFIKPFRDHHVDPKAITRHDFIETNGNNCLANLPLLGGLAPVLPEETGIGFYLCSVVVFITWFLFGSNQFHKWAHADQAPRLVRTLQRWHFILPPVHHDVHHMAPHDRHYCITVGWMNPVLSGVRLFRMLEWSVAAVWPAIMSPATVERRMVARGAAADASARVS
jgi:plasmanylethanolamine desaturase